MSIALAFLLSLQSGDRAVLVRASGDRVEIRDPAVLRQLEALTRDDRQDPAGADWIVSFYKGETLVRELKVLSEGGRQPIAGFLRDQDRIRRLSKDLADESQETREKATLDLVAMGRVALEPTRKLAETTADPEVRARAARVLQELHAAARPRVQVRFFFARKDRPAAAPAGAEEWIRAAAADQGYPAIERTAGTGWTELGLEAATIYPAERSGKPGGVYVTGKTLKWTLDGAVTIDVAATVQGWKTGAFSLDPTSSRKVVRLTDQAGGDLFLAIRVPEGR